MGLTIMRPSLTFELSQWTIYCGKVAGMLREETSCAQNETLNTSLQECSSQTWLTILAPSNDFCDRRDVGRNQAFQTREVLEVVGSRSDDAPMRQFSVSLAQSR